jgi:diacylglycerol kinase family enzyme
MRKVLVIFNTRSGNAIEESEITTRLARHFAGPAWDLVVEELRDGDDVAAISRAARAPDVALVIAAGGDGTVGTVANALVQTPIPLGILPLGTGNDLARALGIPLALDDAIALLGGAHDVAEVDALKVGDRYFFANVSVGISPVMMRETTPALKQRFGLLAYVWTMLRQSNLFQIRRYILTLDGRHWRTRASEVLISSPTLLERPPYVFGPPETLSDGRLEVYLIAAQTLGDYARLVWDILRRPGQSSATLRHWTARQAVRIESAGRPRLVQADGEVIGYTPIEVELAPRALRVIRPATGKSASAPMAYQAQETAETAASAGSRRENGGRE